MNVRTRIAALAATTTLAGLATLGLTAPAQAATGGPAAASSGATAAAPTRVAVGNATSSAVTPLSWNGRCYVNSVTYTGWNGWCDGKGPQTYSTFVDCSNGVEYDASYSHWYGDRRGVYAGCPSGTHRVGQGFIFH